MGCKLQMSEGLKMFKESRKRMLLISIVFLVILSACNVPEMGNSEMPDAPTWQEQYDLGLRYLSEGNYQEAILAFTAAIEIDPKRAEAYVGRGDAHVTVIETLDVASDTVKIDEHYTCAKVDYIAAIDLDALLSQVYEKLANIYIALGDVDAAIAILERGFEATGNEGLRILLEELSYVPSQSVEIPPPDAVGIEEEWEISGVVRMNSDVYDFLQGIDYETEPHPTYGLFLDQPIIFTLNGMDYEVAALSVYHGTDNVLNGNFSSYLNVSVRVTGRVIHIGEGIHTTMRGGDGEEPEEVLSHHCNGPLAIQVDKLAIIQ